MLDSAKKRGTAIISIPLEHARLIANSVLVPLSQSVAKDTRKGFASYLRIMASAIAVTHVGSVTLLSMQTFIVNIKQMIF